MMNRTKILWPWNPLHTVNPFVGCSKVSAGCLNCYAEKMACRLAAMDEAKYNRSGRSMRYVPSDYSEVISDDGKEWNNDTVFRPQVLDAMRKARKPRNIFWCSMSDLFHENNDGADINRVWNVIFNTPMHTHIILTKRPENMAVWTKKAAQAKSLPESEIWPSNVWLGVTAENQECANRRIPKLLSIAGEHKTFVSVEPMLGEVSLKTERIWSNDNWLTGESYYYDSEGCLCEYDKRHLDQVIIGAESGAGARPMNPEWAIELIGQCRNANVPVFVKQFCKNGRAIPFEQWPKEIQVREVAE